MKRWILPLVGLLVVAAIAVPALAQSQQPASSAQAPTVGMGGRGAGAGLLICSTSNPTDTVAQALGMSASDLRVALVSGQTVSEIAASKNVDLQTIQDALATQRQADLDQALKDGLLTQAQYDAITQAMTNAPQRNGIGRFGLAVSAHNVVNREAAAATALSISCADLVKAQLSGESIAKVAGDKGVEVQTVIDAVTNAYKDALAQDVKEGLITQAESDGELLRITPQISVWVNGADRDNGFGGPMGGFGFGEPFGQRDGQGGFGFGRPNGFGGPMGGFGHRGGQNGQNGQGGITPPNGFNGQNNQPGTQTSHEVTPTVTPQL